MNTEALRTLMVLGFLVALSLLTSLPVLGQFIISAQAGLVHYAQAIVAASNTTNGSQWIITEFQILCGVAGI